MWSGWITEQIGIYTKSCSKRAMLHTKSRCKIPAEWRNFNARKIWYKKYCTCWSLKDWGDWIMRWRSVSISSVTIYNDKCWPFSSGGASKSLIPRIWKRIRQFVIQFYIKASWYKKLLWYDTFLCTSSATLSF